MANIAVLFYFPVNGVKPCYYEQLETAFFQERHNVLSVNTYIDKCVNSHFTESHVSIIESFKPELIITFNHVINKQIYKKTSCPVLVIEADTVKYFPNTDLIKEFQDRVWIGVAQEGRISLFKKDFPFLKSDHLIYFPNSTLLKQEDIEQDINISCIATLIGFSLSEDIIVKNIGRSDFTQFNKIIDKARININLLTEMDYDVLRSDYKEVFRYMSYKNRAQVLDALAPLGLKVYGDFYYPEFFAAALPDLFLSLQKDKVFSMEENQLIYNRSKISVNVHFAHNSTIADIAAYSWRVCDILATNACLITTFCPAIKKDFSKWVDIPMFRDRFEAHRLAEKLLKDKPLRENIVQGSQTAIKEGGFLFEKRVKELESLFGLQKSLKPDTAFEFNDSNINLQKNIDGALKLMLSKSKLKRLLCHFTSITAMLKVLGLSALLFFIASIISNIDLVAWNKTLSSVALNAGLLFAFVFSLQLMTNISYKAIILAKIVIKRVVKS